MKLLVIGCLVIMLVGCTSISQDLDIKIAEEWIKTSTTYAKDGFNLSLILHEKSDTEQVFQFSFYTASLLPGNNSPAFDGPYRHEITLGIVDGEVTSAIIDKVWDELQQKSLSELVSMTYQPMQCESLPWSDQDPGIFYLEAYNISLSAMSQVSPDVMVCMACSVCPTDYYFSAQVLSEDVEKMESLGWKS